MKNAIKKQLREMAKNHVTTMGVLRVKNNTTGKQYIKGALNLEALVNKMNFLLKGQSFDNAQLQKDWDEYGSENFSFEFVSIIQNHENQYINYRKEILKAEQDVLSGINSDLLYIS